MARRIAIIQGHPDPTQTHYGHALSAAYEEAARAAGHETRLINVAGMAFEPVQNKAGWESGVAPAAVLEAQSTIEWAEHLVIFYPLWLGSMPALLKAFFEQVFRPGFAVARHSSELVWQRRLHGRSARIVITMGMPVLVYRGFFRAHSLKTLQRNILGFCGIGPVSASLIGMIDAPDPTNRQKWLGRMKDLGQKGH